VYYRKKLDYQEARVRAAKKAGLHAYRFTVVQGLKQRARRIAVGGRNPPSKRCIQLLVKKLETKVTWRREAINVGKYSA
jgi:hypothetical protein